MKISFKPATLDDALAIYEWRNDPTTRISSRNTEPIEWSKHIVWFTNALGTPEIKILVAHDDDLPIGTVRFDYFNDSAELSWMIAPAERKKGYGKAMLAEAVKLELNKELYAIIKLANDASIKMALHCGFQFFKYDGDLGIWKIDKRRGANVPGNEIKKLKDQFG